VLIFGVSGGKGAKLLLSSPRLTRWERVRASLSQRYINNREKAPTLNERQGVTPTHSAMTPRHRRIKELEKKLHRIEKHNEILKKSYGMI